MATAFLLWSSSDSAAQTLSPTPVPDQGPTDPLATPAAKPKPRKGGKPPAPKRPPQRGLGVAQLERLRLQERWRRITEASPDPSAFDAFHRPDGLLGHPISTTFPSAVYVGDWASGCCLPRCRTVGPGTVGYAGGGTGGVPTVRSALHDRFARDRVRISGIPPGSAQPLIEPPSNQSQKALVLADNCDCCARKQLVHGGNIGFRGTDGQDFSVMDLDAPVPLDKDTEAAGYYGGTGRGEGREGEVKEYEFFPRNRSAVLGDSEFADRTAGDASSSAPPPPPPPEFIDLTLKLSYK